MTIPVMMILKSVNPDAVCWMNLPMSKERSSERCCVLMKMGIPIIKLSNDDSDNRKIACVVKDKAHMAL